MAGAGVGTNQVFAARSQPPQMQAVLQKLGEMFGPNLHFLPENQGYVNFHVWNMTDDVLFQGLEDNKEQLFGSELHTFQILRPLGRSTERGVFLRYLEPRIRSEFKAGFSHYIPET
jgi:hypothetical protein